MARLLACLAAACLASVPPLALAQETQTSQIVYVRGPGAEQCPDEEEIRRAVSDRLGYEPFEAGAARTVSIRIERTAEGLTASIEMRSEVGGPTGSRTLSTPEDDCRELARVMSLAISIAIDPLRLAEPDPMESDAPSPEPEPEPPEPPEPPTETDSPPREPAPTTPASRSDEARSPAPVLVTRYGIGALAAFGSVPAPTAGGAASVDVLSGSVSLGLEARYDLPATTAPAPGGRVRASLLLFSLVGCVRREVLPDLSIVSCALGSGGALIGRGMGVEETRRGVSPVAALGARGGSELRLTGSVALRLQVDLLASLTRTSLQLDDEDVWTTPTFSAAPGLVLTGSFS